MAEQGAPSEQALGEIIRRIVDVAQPDKIILSGSAVHGTMGPNSDVDLLVIKPPSSTDSTSWGGIY